MANIKKIIRDEYITIKVSKQEKELWNEYAKKTNINPTRLARNVLMGEASSYLSKFINIPVLKAYKYYLEVTKQKKEIEKLESD